MHNPRQRTLVGLGWTGGYPQLLGQMLQLATTVLLRLLSPKIKTALSDRHLNSVFWLNAATGLALTVIFALAAPVVGSFYGEPQLYLLADAIAPNFVLGSLNVVQSALLDKALNFRIKFWIAIVAALASGLVALVLALRGWGAWSLVGSSLALTIVRVLMMWLQSSWRPAMVFDFSAIRELMRFSRHLTGFGAVFYCSQNMAKLMIGGWIGSSALGIYTLAEKLMRTVIVRTSTTSRAQ